MKGYRKESDTISLLFRKKKLTEEYSKLTGLEATSSALSDKEKTKSGVKKEIKKFLMV